MAYFSSTPISFVMGIAKIIGGNDTILRIKSNAQLDVDRTFFLSISVLASWRYVLSIPVCIPKKDRVLNNPKKVPNKAIVPKSSGLNKRVYNGRNRKPINLIITPDKE